MTDVKRIPLRDGEGVQVVYNAKGEQPVPTVPPDVVPGAAPAVGRVQPGQDNPEPVAGDQLQAPASTLHTSQPGEPLPVIEQEGGTPLPEHQPGGPLPEVAVTVEHPDGTIQGPFEMQAGKVPDYGIHPERGQDSVGPVHISGSHIEGLGEPVSIRVEHPECADVLQKLVVTYVVRGVHADPNPLVEDVPHHESHGCTCQLAGQQAVNVDMFNAAKNHLRRFVLQRDRDDTGVSGTGVVAEGVLLTDGRVVLRWLGERSSIVMWNELDNVMAVHGHNGATRLRWLDMAPPGVPAHPDSVAAQ